MQQQRAAMASRRPLMRSPGGPVLRPHRGPAGPPRHQQALAPCAASRRRQRLLPDCEDIRAGALLGGPEALFLMLAGAAAADEARVRLQRGAFGEQARRGSLLPSDATARQLLGVEGIHPDRADEDGCTWLHLACGQGGGDARPGLVGLLLERGAHADVRCHKGRTPRMVAVGKPRSEADAAARLDCLELLRRHGADLELRDIRGRTLLMMAVEARSSLAVVEWLLARGLQPDAVDNVGKTILQYSHKDHRPIRDAVERALKQQQQQQHHQQQHWESTPSALSHGKGPSGRGKGTHEGRSVSVAGATAAAVVAAPVSCEVQYGRIIGEGGFARVYEGRFRGSPVAIKEARPTEPHAMLLREADLLQRLPRHPCIAEFVGRMTRGDGVRALVVARYKGDLGEALKSGLEPAQRFAIAVQVATGLSFLHSHSIVHCDLKPNNVLLTGQKEAKLCDFGLSRLVRPPPAADGPSVAGKGSPDGAAGPAPQLCREEELPLLRSRGSGPDPGASDTGPGASASASSSGGSALDESMAIGGEPLALNPWFQPPEVLRGEPPGEKADVWSLGVLLYMLAAWTTVDGYRTALGRNMTLEHLANLRLADRLLPQGGGGGLGPEVAALLADCLAHDPQCRPTATEVVVRLEGMRSKKLPRPTGRG
ncbi:putative serine/threonine-protein kinase [Tetrabaena socialis]|uniref:Putative serine/threonine-protein kinase n=1 Tax=Tetrabaena socialis TaxID=47790 RepID=A0A2J7ZZY0_9CHLO|nr:putative serine/threonine-protein kinase [Tetrabaena socialis]|eukprot:PNH05823.1 putative serine/threonine-protein kinase [Tetrabaena socialis]